MDATEREATEGLDAQEGAEAFEDDKDGGRGAQEAFPVRRGGGEGIGEPGGVVVVLRLSGGGIEVEGEEQQGGNDERLQPRDEGRHGSPSGVAAYAQVQGGRAGEREGQEEREGEHAVGAGNVEGEGEEEEDLEDRDELGGEPDRRVKPLGHPATQEHPVSVGGARG